jgi:hypothetical protein
VSGLPSFLSAASSDTGCDPHDEDPGILLDPKTVRSIILGQGGKMAMPAPITIPTEPIGSIQKPADLIDRVANGDAGFRRIYCFDQPAH